MEKDPSRIKILERIEDYERRGLFDIDVEDDPPAPEIKPGTVDYKQKKLSTRLKAKFVFALARKFLKNIEKQHQFIVKEIKGIENLDNLNSGAILTCNHFSAMDSFAMQVAYESSKQSKKRKLFRIIREGNYTGFPGFYGKLMRNCNTLPLSKNYQVLKECMEACKYHLANGHYILIYPEQSMWWNYRKPKPMKPGAFSLAIQNNAPIVPFFICMEDSEYTGEDGFPIQAYTIFVCEPIFPDPNLTQAQNREMLSKKNFEVWKRIYEDFYKIPLTYITEEK